MSTSPALSAPNLLQIVRTNKLADLDRVDAVVKSLPADAADAADPRAVADAMIEAGILTRFQAGLLLQGKSRSLTIAGKYRLIDRLGAGGMGLVYLCEHLKMRRTVALKVLPQKQATEPGQLDRFLREAQAAAAMKHPNIIQAYDIDQDNGVHYLVMEYIDGADLDRLVAAIGPLDPHRAAYYIAQAALGLQHAAERGLVHRDIKPSNLLVDREGVIRVLDLGLARLSDRAGKLTERIDANAVIGTADYIAPEQALNSHEVDIRADIYSLGCTFYFLLAGQAPFKDANVTQKLLMHQMREPTPITDLRPDVPPEMAAVLARMMVKDPAGRYASAADVVDDLAPWIDPPPPPPTEEEIPPRSLGSASPSGSSVHGRSQVTAALPRMRPGVTEALTRRRVGAATGIAPPSSRKKWAMYAGVIALGIVVLSIAAWRPWASPTIEEPVPDGPTAKATVPPASGRPVPRIGRGFSYLLVDVGAPRPAIPNGELREMPTDTYFVTGTMVPRASAEYPELVAVLKRDALGGLLPYAVANVGSTHPNTLLAVDAAGSARALPLNELAPVSSAIRPEHNLHIQGAQTLGSGTLDVHSLVADLSDVTAGPGGTTIRVRSGVVLLTGRPGERDPILGAGTEPLTIDFAGRPGYLTLSSDQDFARPKAPTRELRLRARLVGLGTNPLVISGLTGTVLSLQNVENDQPALVVQGMSLLGPANPDRYFRATFTRDQQLGRPQSPITLADATLAYQGDAAIAIDRPLTLIAGRSGRVTATERAKGPRIQLRWTGKVTGGGKLLKAGNAAVVLANGSNDYWGGTEVMGGVLNLQAEAGTPVGSGPVFVNGGATLSGTGRIPAPLTVRAGGILQPGTENGKPLRATAIVFQRGKEATSATFVARPGSAGQRLLQYDGTTALDLGAALLKISPAPGFQPTRETVVVVIDNGRAPAVRGNFHGLENGMRLVTTDGKWTARISYQGDARAAVPAGGKDVVLHDWAPVKK